jgi:hypothetical protein
MGCHPVWGLNSNSAEDFIIVFRLQDLRATRHKFLILLWLAVASFHGPGTFWSASRLKIQHARPRDEVELCLNGQPVFGNLAPHCVPDDFMMGL